MEFTAAAGLLGLLEHIDIFLVAFVRLLAFFLILPIFAGVNIPNLAKVAFSSTVALLIMISGKVTMVSYSDTIGGFVLLLVREFIVGFVLGFVVFLVFSVVYFAGQLIDYQIGFSMMSVFDPITQIQVPIVGNLFYFVICAFLVQSGGLNALIGAFFYSFEQIPPGTAVLVGNDKLIWYIIKLLTDFFALGVMISMPVMGSILVIDVALGLLVKAVPQMNVFVVGMPIKLLAGLLILVVTAPTLATVYDFVFNDLAYKAMLNMMRGMAP